MKTKSLFFFLVISIFFKISIQTVSALATNLPTGFSDTQLIPNLNQPTVIEFLPDGSLMIGLKAGELKLWKNGQLTTFGTIPSVNADSERGVLGLAVDPNFTSNNYIYVYYSFNGSPVRNRVSRFTVNTTGTPTLNVASQTVLLDNISSAAGIHNAGTVLVGGDGKLYISTGDAGTSSNSQNLGNLSGKILRINRDGSIPSDNPFVSTSGARPEIWAYGLRNPFRISFNTTNSKLYIADVGQNTWEEINEGAGGRNYGWPTCEGACSNGNFTNPIFTYHHSTGANPGRSLTGGPTYTGLLFPQQYRGKYFFADFEVGWLQYLDLSTNQPTVFARNMVGITDMDVGSDGALYYVRFYNTDVGRITYGGVNPTPTPTPTPTLAPNSSPLPVISAPAAGTMFSAGNSFTFSGSATDPQDGTIPASRLSWQINLHHDEHTHPFLGPLTNTTTGSFTIPTRFETDPDVWFRINLTATDSQGVSNTTFRDVIPRKSQITIGTNPTGLQITVDGQPQTAPHTFTGVVGLERDLGATAIQYLSGKKYQFTSWSDGGAKEHIINTPATNTTYTATFTSVPFGACEADINQDQIVDLSDYSSLVQDFLKTTRRTPRSDINRDGITDISDYSILVNSFFKPATSC